MIGEGAFSNANHILALSEERRDGQKIRDDVNSAKLKNLVADLDWANWRLIIRAKNIGAYLNVRGSMVTNKLLVATEFCDLLWPCYYVTST